MPSYRDNPLDESVNTELMRVCKCVIPYLDRDIQKNVAIGLKFLELVNTINTFSSTSSLGTNLSLTRQGNWEDDLLHNVRSNLSPEKAYMIDALIKLQEFKSILNVKENTDSLAPPTSFNDSPTFFEESAYFPRDPAPHVEKPSPKPPQNNAPSPAHILQALSPLLDDNQKQLFNLFTTFMTNK